MFRSEKVHFGTRHDLDEGVSVEVEDVLSVHFENYPQGLFILLFTMYFSKTVLTSINTEIQMIRLMSHRLDVKF